jgi:hypothetical protein
MLSLTTLSAGCTPKKYIAADGKELILKQEYENQIGGIDPTVATRCMEGNTKVYVKLQGDKYNPCVELGIFLINNRIPEEGIPLFEKGIKAVNSYNADESVLRTEDIGIMQSTHLANILYDICLKKPVYNLIDGADITAVICEKAGELFEKVKYRENAIAMYRKKCELSGKCNELRRMEASIKK